MALTTQRLVPELQAKVGIHARVKDKSKIAGSRCTAGVAELWEVPGTIRIKISGVGAVLQFDDRHLVQGIHNKGLDWHLWEKHLLYDLSRLGISLRFTSQKNRYGRLEGFGYAQYGDSEEPARAIYGLHGYRVGDRDLESGPHGLRLASAIESGTLVSACWE